MTNYLYDYFGEERVERLAKIVEKATGQKLHRPVRPSHEYSPGEPLPPITMHLHEREDFTWLVFSTSSAPRDLRLLKKWVRRANEAFGADLWEPHHEHEIWYWVRAPRADELWRGVRERLLREGKLSEGELRENLGILICDRTRGGPVFYESWFDAIEDSEIERNLRALMWATNRAWREWDELEQRGEAKEKPNYLYDYLGEERLERFARIVERATDQRLERPIRPRDEYGPGEVLPSILIDSYKHHTAADYEALEFGPPESIPYGAFLAIRWKKRTNDKSGSQLELSTDWHSIVFRRWFAPDLEPPEYDEIDEMSDEEIERNLRAMLWANERLREEWEELERRERTKEPPNQLYDCLGDEVVETLDKVIRKATGVGLRRDAEGHVLLDQPERLVPISLHISREEELIFTHSVPWEYPEPKRWIEEANERFGSGLLRGIGKRKVDYRVPLSELDKVNDEELEANIKAMLWVEDRAREEWEELMRDPEFYLRELGEERLERFARIVERATGEEVQRPLRPPMAYKAGERRLPFEVEWEMIPKVLSFRVQVRALGHLEEVKRAAKEAEREARERFGVVISSYEKDGRVYISFGDYLPFLEKKSDDVVERGLRAILWARERAEGILSSGL